MQGCVFHWTLSIGASICESNNYFIDMGKSWEKCLDECEELYEYTGHSQDQDVQNFCDDRRQCCSALRSLMSDSPDLTL